MDSKRRMVELHTWEQPFFSELTPGQKLFYWFVISKCDNVGVYRHNPRLVEFHCGEEIDLKEFVEAVNFDQERLELLSEGVLWIKDFVRDTWGTIAGGNNLGLSAYKLLSKHNLLDRFVSECPEQINVQSFIDCKKKAIEGTDKEKGKLRAYVNLPMPQSCPSPAPEQRQGSGKAGTINNPINGSNIISNSTSENVEKKESLIKVAERILKVWPKSSGDTNLTETNSVISKLEESEMKGEKIADVEKRFISYLKGERTRIMETGEDPDLIDILDKFELTIET